MYRPTVLAMALVVLGAAGPARAQQTDPFADPTPAPATPGTTPAPPPDEAGGADEPAETPAPTPSRSPRPPRHAMDREQPRIERPSRPRPDRADAEEKPEGAKEDGVAFEV